MGISLCKGKHYSREGGWNLKQLILPLIIEKELNMGSDVDAYVMDIWVWLIKLKTTYFAITRSWPLDQEELFSGHW